MGRIKTHEERARRRLAQKQAQKDELLKHSEEYKELSKIRGFTGKPEIDAKNPEIQAYIKQKRVRQKV